MINIIKAKILSGKNIDWDEALYLSNLADEEPEQVLELASQITKQLSGNKVELCAITNGKSGSCSEDCRFCAQSAHYKTGTQVYSVISPAEALDKAKKMEAAGVGRFSLVTSGRGISDRDFEKILEIFQVLRKETSLQLCASLGIIDYDKATHLKEIGVTRYHHNLEASCSFFPNICTTHTYQERIDTIVAVRQAGLEVCAGGIIGLGETRRQRLELAFDLRKLEVVSVPINVLNPIPGTPLSEQPMLSAQEVLLTIALFRAVLPGTVIRLCGGRERALGQSQAEALHAGLNGLMVGNYLTTLGRTLKDDLSMLKNMGMKIERKAV